jgi:protein-S-isoprenylcysteine O-methyltransferase Ste14
MGFLHFPILGAHWVIASLDVGRFHWSDGVPSPLQSLGFAAFALSVGLRCWALKVNPFYSSVVRIQSEREHHLITAGPYKAVRHPGYLSGILNMVSSGLALGSWLSLAPIAVGLGLYPRRILIEERVLLQELTGYREYAQRVRYRLVPGLW